MPNGCCTGEKPWLGSDEENDACNKKVDFIQRASTSAYFPNSISSILIPPYSDSLRRIIDSPRRWKKIEAIMKDAKIEENDGRSIFDEKLMKFR